jgi:hypothetical protein
MTNAALAYEIVSMGLAALRAAQTEGRDVTDEELDKLILSLKTLHEANKALINARD